MTDKQILRKVATRPKTATEIGVPISKLYTLEKQGHVVRAGHKQTGTVGRPPVLWLNAATPMVVVDRELVAA